MTDGSVYKMIILVGTSPNGERKRFKTQST